MITTNIETVYGEKLNPNRSHRVNGKYDGIRQEVVLTNSPSVVLPGEELAIRLPTLGSADVIVPGSIKVLFDLVVTKGSTPINNIARSIVNRINVSLDGNELININHSNIFYNYIEQWDSKEVRDSKAFYNGIISEDHSADVIKERLGHKSKTSVLSKVYGSTFAIPLDFELFKTSLPFNGSSLSSKLIYKLHFVDKSAFLDVDYEDGDDDGDRSEKNTAADYKVTNIRLRFTKITSRGLANQVVSAFSGSYTLLYDRVHHMKTFPVSTSDQLWNWTIATPVKSLRGILLIGKLNDQLSDYGRVVDKTWNMDIKRINITIEGVNNVLYDKGLRQSDIYDEAIKFWSGAYKSPADIDRMTKELKLSTITPKKFYEDHYCIWLDLRCIEDNHLHGSGMKLNRNSEGITLAIERNSNGGTAKKGKVFAFLMMDASTEIDGNEYEGVKW